MRCSKYRWTPDQVFTLVFYTSIAFDLDVLPVADLTGGRCAVAAWAPAQMAPQGPVFKKKVTILSKLYFFCTTTFSPFLVYHVFISPKKWAPTAKAPRAQSSKKKIMILSKRHIFFLYFGAELDFNKLLLHFLEKKKWDPQSVCHLGLFS